MMPSGVCADLHLKLCALFNESLSLEERLRNGQELCENLENATGEKEMHDLTHNVYERIQKFMTSTEPQNLQESPLHQLRRICLEIFQKMPNGDHLRPYARLILALLFKLVENEENVLLCVKLIIELHKYYRPSFSLDYHILPKSCFSLKVMQEIPILVVLMYQLFKQHIHQDVSEFIPIIMEFINLKPSEAQKKNPGFNQDVFIDFMAAQVKTLSFLAYVIKIYQELVERYSDSLVQGMMNLLYNCPPSVTNMRKEFFIAARHILSAQQIRPKFLDVLDELMNEDILIGQGYTVRDSLRPLAYSTLADLTHHIRGELSLAKIARAIDVYGRNLHDDTLPFSIQHMSLRLLLNLVECIRQRAVAASTTVCGLSGIDHTSGVSPGTARHLLLLTLRLCVLKSRVVTEYYLPALEATCIPEMTDDQPITSTKDRSYKQWGANLTSGNAENLNHGSLTGRFSADGLKMSVDSCNIPITKTNESYSKGQLSHLDLRALVKALMTGVRTIVTSLVLCPRELVESTVEPSSITHTNKTASLSSNRFLTPDELVVLAEYFNYGMRMVDIVHVVVRDGKLYTRSHSSAKSPDERLLIETFALTFVQLSPVSFQEIFISKIHDFVSWCRQSPSYVNMALHLLSDLNKTSCFGNVLLSYLVDRLDRLG
ncbi:transformation/transcription domain-associated protein, partial [Paragonimus westermani]